MVATGLQPQPLQWSFLRETPISIHVDLNIKRRTSYIICRLLCWKNNREKFLTESGTRK